MMGRAHAIAALAGVVISIIAALMWRVDALNDRVDEQRQQIEAAAEREGAYRAAIAAQNAEVDRLHAESVARMQAAEQARAAARAAGEHYAAAADKLLRLKLPQEECHALAALVDAAVAADLDRLRASAD